VPFIATTLAAGGGVLVTTDIAFGAVTADVDPPQPASPWTSSKHAMPVRIRVTNVIFSVRVWLSFHARMSWRELNPKVLIRA
jgi:hypothetical protein